MPFDVVQPSHTALDIVIQRHIVLLVAQGIRQKLRNEQGDSQFLRLEGNREERLCQSDVAEALQGTRGPLVIDNLQDRKRLEELFFDLPPPVLRQMTDKRHPSPFSGKDIDNGLRVTISHHFQHDSARFYFHTTAKIRKIKHLAKINEQKFGDSKKKQ